MIAWIDLETTGLKTDCGIIEVAVVVTDTDYEIREGFEAIVGSTGGLRVEATAQKMHAESGLWDKALASDVRIDEVDQEVESLLSRHQDGEKPYILAGSSVHFDRGFITKWMPLTDRKLHYRNLDVSSVKIFVSNATGFPTEELPPFKSTTKHRAMDDIMDSINAIKWYRDICLDPKIMEGREVSSWEK